MDTIDRMKLFVRVAETGSFTIAARQLGCATARVSRAISALEQHLGVRLLQRTTRHLGLTESGRTYLVHCETILQQLAIAEAEARNKLSHPQGVLRVHSVLGLGQMHITPAVVEYQRKYPEVSVELTLSQSMPNLVEAGYDISVTAMSQLPDSAYVAQNLGQSYNILAASRHYLQENGVPENVADLSRHRCLTLYAPNSEPSLWRLYGSCDRHVVEVSAALRLNMPEAMRFALKNGAGIGPLALYSCTTDIQRGDLVRVLPQYRLDTLNVYAVYPSRRYVDAKVSTFLDHLRQAVSPRLEAEMREMDSVVAGHMPCTPEMTRDLTAASR